MQEWKIVTNENKRKTFEVKNSVIAAGFFCHFETWFVRIKAGDWTMLVVLLIIMIVAIKIVAVVMMKKGK